MARDGVDEAKATGAQAIVTACPPCVTVLRPPTRRAKMEIYELPVLAAKSMGLKI
ncbi:MAG: hypothetical protein ACTSWP_06595 [Candidatus Freyarchaeota archaeon]